MILTSVQGVHHVLGRDKDLVCPIKLAIKAVTLKKKKKENKGKMENEISNFLSPSVTQNLNTSADI